MFLSVSHFSNFKVTQIKEVTAKTALKVIFLFTTIDSIKIQEGSSLYHGYYTSGRQRAEKV